MSTPHTTHDAILHAARDVAKVDTALDAELLGSTLLGSVYAIAESGRGEAVREFVGGFLARTARRRTVAARTIRTIFATLVPEAPGAKRVRPGSSLPAWSSQLGQVRPVGTWAYGDVYGDQTSFLAIFEYQDPTVGGPMHAVVALVDHNIGIVKDVFVSKFGEQVLAEVRRTVETDELVWLKEVDPATLRAEVTSQLDITDELTTLPEEGSVATDRALVGARLTTLPADGAVTITPPADPGALTREFLGSPQAAALDRSTAEPAVQYTVRLILEFAQDSPDGDPLRWSPAVAGLFLLDWVHRRAVLDQDDVAALPPVLLAWTAWAATRRKLPATAAAGTAEAIETMAPEFVRLHDTGERRGAAVQAMSELLAAGVDPDDPDALGSWLATRTNNRPTP